jgi:hypothetical protein
MFFFSFSGGLRLEHEWISGDWKFDFNQDLSLVKRLGHATGFKYIDKNG